MASVTHRISGLGALHARLAGLPDQARAAAAAGLGEVAAQAADAARAELSGGSGRSGPGAPPADPSGRLAASIASTVDPETGRAAVTASAPEARFLEYGTAKMAARPFLRPAALKAGRGARAILRAALRRGIAP